MPRKRTSTERSKRRAKIGTREECQKELQRTIHRADNNEITPAYAARRIDWLTKLLNTMPETPPEVADYQHPGFNICPMVSGTWLSSEACKTLVDTNRLPEGSTITLIEPRPDASKLDLVPEPVQPPEDPDKDYIEKVVTLRRKPEKV